MNGTIYNFQLTIVQLKKEDILNIHQLSMNKNNLWIKMIFGFIVLLRSLVRVAYLTIYRFSNDEAGMVRPAIVDMNPVELQQNPFMISLNKCTWSCNILFPKICFPKETKKYMLKDLIWHQTKMKPKQW